MSTYINPMKPGQKMDFGDCPQTVREFLQYSLTIRGLSPRTVNGYYIDLRTFFKFLVWHRGQGNLHSDESSLSEIPIDALDIAFVRKVDKAEVYEFLFHITKQRNNAAATRARKLSSLKGYFKYLTTKTGALTANPVDDIERPNQKKRLPKYLTLDESFELLNNIQSDFYARDYCIVTLFLNCGMRLSELVGLNVSDIKDDTLRLVGKGNKERMVYLNDACQNALQGLQEELMALKTKKDKNALFISKHTGQRLSARRVQQVVNGCLATAGLAGKGYSVHKLRHTAATLLYQHGHVDLLALKEILGHVDVSTTQIYTHLDSSQLKRAAEASPLAKAVPKK